MVVRARMERTSSRLSQNPGVQARQKRRPKTSAFDDAQDD